ncbi:MAG: LptE family protein, partial [Mucinivorans sp.]
LMVLITISGCTVHYAFTGASVDYNLTKTVSIQYINNMAAMVTPILSPQLTDALIQKMQRETRLQIVSEEGDMSFAGEIIDYRSDPISISANETAVQNRLTIAVRIRFVNKAQPNNSFERSFSNYADYPSDQMLTSVEAKIIPEIVTKIVDDIFNAALGQW